MAYADQWIAEANARAKQYADSLRQQSQYLIDQQNQAKQSALNELANQNTSAINKLNAGKDTVAQTALDNAKQANINRLLALRSNQQAMNRAGLGTQGIVGSQVNSINNNYGTNLNNILNEKAKGIQNIDSQIADTNLAYNTNRVNLANQYDSNIAQVQKQIDDSALNQYNTIYQQYLALKQQEYENQQAELQRQEAIRQYNENLALQKAQFEYQKQQAARQSYSSSSRSSGGNSYTSNVGFTNSQSSPIVIRTKYYNGSINPDTQYGTFGTKDLNGVNYQPDNIGNQKLKSSGMKVSKFAGKTGIKNSSGVNIDGQTVWTLNGRYYIWNGSNNQYEEITR